MSQINVCDSHFVMLCFDVLNTYGYGNDEAMEMDEKCKHFTATWM